MQRHIDHDNATSNVLAWSAHAANTEPSAEEDAGADADEPPDPRPTAAPSSPQFRRNVVRCRADHHESLLTKALQSHSEEETLDNTASLIATRRRRSITSNVSFASTAELTSDTGITTPARTSSPSPRLPAVSFAPLPLLHVTGKTDPPAPVSLTSTGLYATEPIVSQQSDTVHKVPAPALHAAAASAVPKKKCISFACLGKPAAEVPLHPRPSCEPTAKCTALDAPRRPSIKFACQGKPAPCGGSPRKLQIQQKPGVQSPAPAVQELAASVRKLRTPSTSRSRSNRSSTPRRSSQSPLLVRHKKYLTANPKDLEAECSRFHEFASDEHQEDDWIRQAVPTPKRKLTIDDTLEKENAIRKLGKEAEEEAELEEDEDDNEGNLDADEADDADNVDEDAASEADEIDNLGSDDDISDGYNTDNEIGFADSDDEDDDDLVLWTTSQVTQVRVSGATPVYRGPSYSGHMSDSSANSGQRRRISRAKARGRTQVAIVRPGTPELPDSTDFVCGTLDEDRPLEEAYISCMEARKREKLRLIPQDIDPSFPTSDPEDEAQDVFQAANQDSDEHVWLHGEIEDLDHEHEHPDGRRRKADRQSPRRYHSPPPRRHHSPPPKPRGRSPRRLFDRQSPCRHLTPLPPPHFAKSPPASPVQSGQGIAFKALAFRPGLTHTKSLPKPPALFPHRHHRRGRAGTVTKEKHMRGAIDIVKGLEQKRQRRKEKFYQKYCSRARKGHVQEKRAPPGQGAERMRELGLLMAGKIQGNYVLSI